MVHANEPHDEQPELYDATQSKQIPVELLLLIKNFSYKFESVAFM